MNNEETEALPVSPLERFCDETIAALIAADCNRLEALLLSIGTVTVTFSAAAPEGKRIAAKRSQLGQLLKETAANLRVLKRIMNLGRSEEYDYRLPQMP